MQLIKVAAAILNQTPLDWEQNTQNIIEAINNARNQGVSLLCLPELCITGYGCEDAFYAPNTCAQALEVLVKILPHTQGMVVSVGLPLFVQNQLFNTACLIVNGKVAGFVAKKFLAGQGIHYEQRWFKAWKSGEITTIQLPEMLGGAEVKVGDVYFDIGGVKIGYEICEDAWVANRPGRDLYKYGIDILLNPSASHFAFGKLEIRKRFVLEGSRAFGVSYIYANLLGNEAGRAIYDGGALVATNGEMIATGKRFSYANWEVTTTTIDIELTRLAQIQNQIPFDTADDYRHRVQCDFTYPECAPMLPHLEQEAWEKSPFIKEEEFSRAVSLALFDYMRKSFSRGFVISLSGGADSAAVAALCYLLIELGIESVGTTYFLNKLDHIKALAQLDQSSTNLPHQIAQQLITCAYQATRNSGKVTLQAAAKLAEGIGSEFHELDVEPLRENYVSMVSKAIGRPLTWEQDDITLQNIQARLRSPGIWMFANLKGALLLSTSNRSEAAVGYATMDGDTSGGVSPIAGIDKAFLRQWLRWLQNDGLTLATPDQKLTLPSLEFVNNQQPTAELRPQDSHQTDEGDLMPYDLLDDIEEHAIRDKRTPLECLTMLKATYTQYEVAQLKTWTDKFFKLWCRNQWKRERYAPSFHLDDKNLDPKTWCRFPILSGGFKKELAEMWAHG
ncbi:NAD(+) synthase [uncultured Microscilla sp.]|uniref:NAD(+) synthase n=1 Tax=uncultured Microscilla sp. TaxID=432653 RepID=UPI002623F81D|nr:NAD(+) synthase [uncultured Microscilla sp.]